MKYKRPNECRFCTSRKCTLRIVSLAAKFDDIACGRHIRDLEVLADNELGAKNGIMRAHISGTSHKRRGEAQ